MDRETPDRLVFYDRTGAVCFIPNMREVEKKVRALIKEEYGLSDEIGYMLNYWYFEPYFHLYEKTYERERIRPITSRVTYVRRCNFKEMFRYIFRVSTP